MQEKIEFIKQNMSQSIVLVGLMGAGKSSLGCSLAKAIGVEFVDSDQVIEKLEGCTIEDIFEEKGELYFREIERKTILELLQDDKPKIIGTGGGAFMNDETRQAIKDNATSVFIRATSDVLAKRVGDGAGRPMLFKGKPPIEKLVELMHERYPIYELADLSVCTFDEPLPETLNRVQEAVYTRLSVG